MTYARWLRPLLFRLDPEATHNLTLRALALAAATAPGRGALRRTFAVSDPALRTSAFGLDFANPVGLAAGYDKDGRAVTGLGLLGCGHVELGTVTPLPQSGSPRPRVFRLAEDSALVNRMGFPNRGVQALRAAALARARRHCAGMRIGINIGKGKDTRNEDAPDEYAALLAEVYDLADYVAVNVSSPNTPGLRALQAGDTLAELLAGLVARRDEWAQRSGRQVPLLVKIAPDLSWPELDAVLEALHASGADGLIATNTTVDRSGVRSAAAAEAGGMSGAPLRARATEIIRYTYQHTGGRLPIVGVGGIDNPAAALEKIRAGATLVQVYTGLVYRGPGLVREINRGLARAVRREGVATVQALVGTSAAT